jgi:maltooligosyltrehalose trehalohydrolase
MAEGRNSSNSFRRLPIGAELHPEGGVSFRVWAPKCKTVEILFEDEAANELASVGKLDRDPKGYFSATIPEIGEGTLYWYRLDEGSRYPDPASRFQPRGPEGPSQVINPDVYPWKDEGWQGVSLQGQVIYEMHIGTFTVEGTWKAAEGFLDSLVETGITILEIMPVADFAGGFGWGYDGVDLFAPTRLYGTPDDFRHFVDSAHNLGLGVILDVVYNHFGPSGNFLRSFSLDYFTDRYENEWGEAINFDGINSGPVREFVVSNAQYWIDEFHLDGLRLDATQTIMDHSPRHVLADLARNARRAARNRSIVIIAENEPQDVKLLRPISEGGFRLDALWNDDFHHSAVVSLTGRKEAYYMDYLGAPQEFISSTKWGYLYQGQFYSWQGKRRGTPTYGIAPSAFVNFLQNHDQVANSVRGERIQFQTTPGRLRAMTTLLLLGPATPMLFQGQEFCASTPFCYFADHHGKLGEKVREGRMEFLKQFKSLRSSEIQGEIPDPSQVRTFEDCKLDHTERKKNFRQWLLHRDLLEMRRADRVFCSQRSDWIQGAVLGPEAFVLRFFGEKEGDRLLLLNFGKDLKLPEIPEPLMAPPEKSKWELLWSSESPQYGGNGTPTIETDEYWILPGHSAIVLATRG